jgi:Fic family protein
VRVPSAPTFDDLFRELSSSEGQHLVELIRTRASEPGDGYVHWDTLRHREPPNGLTLKEWWFVLKWTRRQLFRELPLTDPDGQPFVYGMPDPVQRALYQVDQRCSGEIAMPEVVTADDQARHHYLVNSLMEEAIRSSQLEGATTSRRVAKDLLRSGREPKDRSERMILNNYLAIQFMREVGDELTTDTIFELHRIVTDGTLDDPSAAGRAQTPDEVRVAVYDRNSQQLLHKPPPADQLPERLQALCDFANADSDSDPFIHPVLRAILLHFWLAYDHPFEDGNGRTARALFYWYMRTRGYWLVDYLSVSRILADAPAKYARAFLYTETDERDTTYFIRYQLDVIERAVTELHAYLRRKVQEVRNVERLMQAGSARLNRRQLALLSHAVRNPGFEYTFHSHSSSHGVTHETARNDLVPLVDMGLLERRRTGRQYLFTPNSELAVEPDHVVHPGLLGG